MILTAFIGSAFEQDAGHQMSDVQDNVNEYGKNSQIALLLT